MMSAPSVECESGFVHFHSVFLPHSFHGARDSTGKGRVCEHRLQSSCHPGLWSEGRVALVRPASKFTSFLGIFSYIQVVGSRDSVFHCALAGDYHQILAIWAAYSMSTYSSKPARAARLLQEGWALHLAIMQSQTFYPACLHHFSIVFWLGASHSSCPIHRDWKAGITENSTAGLSHTLILKFSFRFAFPCVI